MTIPGMKERKLSFQQATKRQSNRLKSTRRGQKTSSTNGFGDMTTNGFGNPVNPNTIRAY